VNYVEARCVNYVEAGCVTCELCNVICENYASVSYVRTKLMSSLFVRNWHAEYAPGLACALFSFFLNREHALDLPLLFFLN
jgi:hypothetical protein